MHPGSREPVLYRQSIGVESICHHHVPFGHLLLHHFAALGLVIRSEKVAEGRMKVASVDNDRLRTPRHCTVHLMMEFLAEMIYGHGLLLTISRSVERAA